MYGYNSTLRGEGSSGRVITEETRKKMSESQKERFQRPEEKEKLKLRSKDKKPVPSRRVARPTPAKNNIIYILLIYLFFIIYLIISKRFLKQSF